MAQLSINEAFDVTSDMAFDYGVDTETAVEDDDMKQLVIAEALITSTGSNTAVHFAAETDVDADTDVEDMTQLSVLSEASITAHLQVGSSVGDRRSLPS